MTRKLGREVEQTLTRPGELIRGNSPFRLGTLIVEFRNKTDEAILLKIGDGHKQVENIGLAEGDAMPIDLPVSGSLTVEFSRPIKKQYCG